METEIQRITNKNKGELPKGNKTVIRVAGITNASEVLGNFKNAIIAFLKNQNLSGDNKKWEKLLPPIYQKFVSQLDFNDYANDELIYNIVQ